MKLLMVNNYISTSLKGVCLAFFAIFISTLAVQAQYNYKTTVGSVGTGNLQFDSPEGIAVGPDGKIYVADRNNDRVQVLNADFTYNTQFGGLGTGSGQFENPIDITVDDSGNIYVVDRSNHRLQVFNSSYVFQFQIGTKGVRGSGNNEFDFPEGVAVDNDNNLIYVADRNNDRVQVFNTSGTYIRTIGTIEFPVEVIINSSGNIYVAAQTTDFVYEYTSTGTLVNSLNGAGGSGNGQFDLPTSLALDASGNLYISDRNNDRLVVFNSSLVWQYNITTPNASGANGFAFPTDITFDSNSNLLVTEPSEDHFEVFESLATEPDVTLSVSPASASENGGNATLTATLSVTYTSDVTVNLAYSGTATGGGTDYTAPASITVSAGNTTGTGTINFVNDGTDEPNETVIVDISSVTNGTESGTQQVTATIIDDDAAPAISVNDITPGEASGTASFTVSLSAASAKTITVNYATADGTANAGTDYTATSGTLTFNPGETSKSVDVSITDDALDEANETFVLNLSSASNATIADTQGLATITDNDSAPSISVNDVTAGEGDGTLTFTVSLSAASAQTITVGYATADNTALAGSDYTATSGTLTFLAGETSKTVAVTLNDNTADETDETFNLNLASATNATISDAQGAGTITDNDASPALSVNDVTAGEGDATLTFTVSLSAVSGQTVTVDFATADNTALAGSDYTATSGTLTFLAGETSKTVAVTLNDDTADETDETFNLNLSSATNATIADAQGVGTITDNDAAPAISVNDVTADEGDGTLTFTVSLTASSAQVITVDYATANGSATAGSDYTATSGTLSFAAGETSKTVSVSLSEDVLDEANETLSLNLSAAANATISDAQGIGTITDNDAAPALSVNDVTAGEGDGTLTFTVSLSEASAQTVTVDYATADGSATAGSDYTATSGTLTFLSGETSKTVAVSLTDDAIDEADEAFNLNLASATNATISDAQGAGTITDNDASPVLSVNDVTAGEGDGTLTFTVSLSAISGKTVTVGYATADNSALAGSDYTATSGTLTFLAGETSKTVAVSLTDDAIDEADEAFVLGLTSAVNATISDNQGTGTITDNDAAPVISVNDVTAGEGDGTLTFTVSLSAISSQTITVDYATANNTATAGSDYTATSGTLTFLAGETSKAVEVTLSDDNIDEADEAFNLNLSSAVNATISDAQGVATISDNDVAGVTLSTTTVSVQENGTNDTYTIALDSEPAANVIVSFTTDGQVDPIASITFTHANWNNAQTVTVSAINDMIDEADPHTSTIQHTVASSDANFNGIAVSDVTVSIQDDDAAGLFLTASAVSVTEDGATDSYRVRLTSEPLADVTVSFTTDAQLNAIASLTFTPANWNTLQTVTVSAVDDDVAEFTHTSVIQHVVTSTDPFYNGVDTSGDNVTATIADNDDPGIVLNKTEITVAEDGTVTDSYTIVLTSEPVAAVTISFTTGADLDAISNVIFTSANWDTPQTVNVVATDDGICEGPEVVSIVHNASSADGNYDGIDLSGETVTVNIADDGPATANAVIDQSSQEICEDSFALTANDPAAGETGTWSSTIAGVSFTDPNSSSTTVNLVPGANDITWTISKGGCEISTSITITNNKVTSVANIIQSDMGICTNSVALSAAAADAGEAGIWSSASGLVNFSPNASSQTVTATDIPEGEETIYYTVTRGGSATCDPSVDSVTIINYDVTARVNTVATEVCNGTV
ncbi:MAG: Calx-beta domain-containing protein, partial [Cyclobacteriaceae bacterium]